MWERQTLISGTVVLENWQSCCKGALFVQHWNKSEGLRSIPWNKVVYVGFFFPFSFAGIFLLKSVISGDQVLEIKKKKKSGFEEAWLGEIVLIFYLTGNSGQGHELAIKFAMYSSQCCLALPFALKPISIRARYLKMVQWDQLGYLRRATVIFEEPVEFLYEVTPQFVLCWQIYHPAQGIDTHMKIVIQQGNLHNLWENFNRASFLSSGKCGRNQPRWSLRVQESKIASWGIISITRPGAAGLNSEHPLSAHGETKL